MCGDLFFAFTMVKPHRTITKALMYNYIFSTGLQGNYKLVSFNIHSITNQSNITKISFRLNILPYSFLSQIITVEVFGIACGLEEHIYLGVLSHNLHKI